MALLFWPSVFNFLFIRPHGASAPCVRIRPHHRPRAVASRVARRVARRRAMPAPNASAADALTELELRVYDRQIRVWGVETQRRLGRASVLACAGATTTRATTTTRVGALAETLKNVALAGVGRAVIRDDAGERAEASRGEDGNFLNAASTRDDDADDVSVSRAEAMATTLREMNAFGEFEASTPNGRALADDAEALDGIEGFDAVVVAEMGLERAMRVNEACRRHGKPFFAAFSGASAAWFFADLGDAFEYAEGDEVKIAPRGATLRRALDAAEADFGRVKRRSPRMPLAVRVVAEFERAHGRAPTMEDWDALDALRVELPTRFGASADCVDAEHVRALVSGEREFPAINAIVGGVLAQEILKSISRKGAPCVNLFTFDVASGQGATYDLGGGETAR